MSIKSNYSFFAILLFSLSVAFTSCGTLRRPYYSKEQSNWQDMAPPDSANLKYSVFLIGDAGDPDGKPVLELLNQQLKARDTVSTVSASRSDTPPQKEINSKDAVIFLGDNIYPAGLPRKGAENRKEKEKIINRQMDVLKGFGGLKVFIPGNHDWNGSGLNGLEAVIRQENYIEHYGDSTIIYLPNRGCPGPYELQVNEDLVILFIDTEWYLTKNNKPKAPENNCFVKDRDDFIAQLHDAIERNRENNILIVQHHPLFSNGNHGGYFSFKDHVFPLTAAQKSLYIPMPIIGSLYPLSRNLGISRQDMSHSIYKQMVREMLSAMEGPGNIVLATGHDHNLQLIKHENISQIISGSGSKTTFAIQNHGATFVYSHLGFAKINYYGNGSAWVEFWIIDKDEPKGKLIFRTLLYSFNASGEKK